MPAEIGFLSKCGLLGFCGCCRATASKTLQVLNLSLGNSHQSIGISFPHFAQPLDLEFVCLSLSLFPTLEGDVVDDLQVMN